MGTTYDLLVNGSLVDSATGSSTPFGASAPFKVSGSDFVGTIGNLIGFKYALTDDEIREALFVMGAGGSSGYLDVPDSPGSFIDEAGNLITSYTNSSSISACSANLDDIVADLCERAGLDATEYDVTELTDTLAGFKCATESTAQAFMMPLGEAFFFDPGEWDKKLRFIKRGGASAKA